MEKIILIDPYLSSTHEEGTKYIFVICGKMLGILKIICVPKMKDITRCH